MLTPHPLNQAIIAQVLHDLRNGQLRHCLAMGFEEHDLEALKHPELVSMLVNAKVPWCKVTVNRAVLLRLLQQGHVVKQEIALIDRMLRLNASTEMLNQFFGLTNQEIALRRDILDLPRRKGRHAVLTEDQEAMLWKQWRDEMQARNIVAEDTTALLSLTMDIAETTQLPLAVLWMAVQQWIKQALV